MRRKILNDYNALAGKSRQQRFIACLNKLRNLLDWRE